MGFPKFEAYTFFVNVYLKLKGPHGGKLKYIRIEWYILMQSVLIVSGAGR